MIARIQKVIISKADSNPFFNYLKNISAKKYRNLPGNKGVYILERPVNAEKEILFISFWQSLNSIKMISNSSEEGSSTVNKKYLEALESNILHYDISFESFPPKILDEDSWKPLGVIF